MKGLYEQYTEQIVPAMRAVFGYSSIMAVPKILKIVIHTGVGRLRDEKERNEVEKYIAVIAGQKPSPRLTKKAIASFKTREGMVVGYQITLRGQRMYDFLSRLINIAFPRTRDFQGIATSSFDGRGNLTIGIKEHIIFPEMIGEDYRILFGLEITIVTNARKRVEAIELLRKMGFPLKQD